MQPILTDNFLSHYPVIQTMSQSGKGGTFLAIDSRSPEFSPLLLKVGYRNGGIMDCLTDGKTHIESEIDIYRRLSLIALRKDCPALIDHFSQENTAILVTEFIVGADLRTQFCNASLNLLGRINRIYLCR